MSHASVCATTHFWQGEDRVSSEFMSVHCESKLTVFKQTPSYEFSWPVVSEMGQTQ